MLHSYLWFIFQILVFTTSLRFIEKAQNPQSDTMDLSSVLSDYKLTDF